MNADDNRDGMADKRRGDGRGRGVQWGYSTSNIRRNALKRVIFPGKYVPVSAPWLDTTNGAANPGTKLLLMEKPHYDYIWRNSDPLPTETNLLSLMIRGILAPQI